MLFSKADLLRAEVEQQEQILCQVSDQCMRAPTHGLSRSCSCLLAFGARHGARVQHDAVVVEKVSARSRQGQIAHVQAVHVAGRRRQPSRLLLQRQGHAAHDLCYFIYLFINYQYVSGEYV